MRKTIMVLAVCGLASAAQANAILSFGFTDMSSSFNAGTGSFSSVSVNSAPFSTAGFVNRLQEPLGNAQFNAGAAGGLVNVALSVTDIVGGTANGTGSLTIFDVDGDSLTSSITGTFALQGGAVFFNGLLPDPAFVHGPAGNGMFNGPSGGSFPLTFAPAPGPYTGAVVQLYFDAGTFFGSSFSSVATNLNGTVVPAPGALAVLGLGMLAATRRRR